MTDKEFADYWVYLVNKKYTSKLPFSFDERIFYAANVFRRSVPRSGLIGFFENTECDVIRDVHLALEKLNLFKVLQLLQDGQRIALNGKSLPETEQFIFLYDLSLPEEEIEQAMDELDDKVQEIENQLYLQDEIIYDSLCRFANERNLGIPKS